MASGSSLFTLGLDTGTTSSRALLVDERGHVRHSFTHPHQDMRMDQPLWAEQDPDDWWLAARHALAGLVRESGVPASSIAAIGLTGQMHGLVLLDQAGKVIRPALIWCDNRSGPQVAQIHQRIGLARMVEATSNPAITGFTLPKLLWVRQHEPDRFRAVRHILLPKDYIRFKLTGDLASDVSDASGTALFDVVHRRWSDVVSHQMDIDPALLPRVLESVEITGKISPSAASETGLQAGTPVVAGAGDQAASALGNGIVATGKVSCTVGTSGVVFAHLEAPGYDPAGRVHTFCHAVPGAWHVMGVTQGAGLSLQWFRSRFAPGSNYDDLTQEAAQAPAGSQGLFWLPYLMGERTPHLDPLARGAWVGLTAKHERTDLVRSVLEGVCYSLRDGLEIMRGLGTQVASVRLSGGGARSAFWSQLFADIFDTPVAILASQEGSAYGAALLGLLASGVFPSAAKMADEVIQEVAHFEPDRARAAFYREQYDLFRSLYPALQPVYQTVGQTVGQATGQSVKQPVRHE